ncbi:MAG TPA: hypothetical protein VGC60_10915 [Pyrinomonadaceae bacterium]
MIFLIQYDRHKGRLVSMESFADSERTKAQETLLTLELELNQNGNDKEVVLLEAESEDAIRRTHRRYFEDLTELTTVPAH